MEGGLIMSNLDANEGTIRRLWPTETDKFREHLLRLDRDSRRMRFAHSVSDDFIDAYASRMTEYGSLVYGHLVDGKVRGAAELRRLGDGWGDEAEAAFSVESPYQDHGLGTDLMGRVVRAARNPHPPPLHELPGRERQDAGDRPQARRAPALRVRRCGG
jgi:GNAT superfamily N-acetyltransferase